MFSSGRLWVWSVAYLMVTLAIATIFAGGITEELPTGSPAWQRIFSVAILTWLCGLGLTWSMLYLAARTLSKLTAALAEHEDQHPVTGPLLSASSSLESAIASTNRRLQRQVDELRWKSSQLEASTQRLETLLGSMVEGVLAVDDRHHILFANRAARAMFDMPELQSIGRPIWEVVRHPKVNEVIRAIMAGEDHPVLELDVPRKHAVVALIASRLPGKPTPGAVLVFHNVTELRRLENLRREFVSNVSHELKTPLTAIEAYAETLLDGALDDPENRRPFVERIADQAQRLHALIQDVLELARIESGQDIFHVRPIDVATLVSDCLEDKAHAAQLRRQQLVAADSPTDIRVLADEQGLRTILTNLLDNAIKYTQEEGCIQIGWRQEGAQALIDIEDNGPGIPQEDQARIFERFFRVDKARSQVVEGTGLGLAIVKHLAQEFRGSITVDSALGRGSRFTLRLPLCAEEVRR